MRHRQNPGFLLAASLVLLAAAVPLALEAQEGAYPRERLMAVAREIIANVRYGTMATIDADGTPRLRTMDPFPPTEDMVIWLATNPNTRKVEEIRSNPTVSLHYFDPDQLAYVTLKGRARLVSDPDEKRRRFKEEWSAFYPNRGDAYMLIEVIPDWMEVVSVGHGINGPDDTWLPPRVVFSGN